VTVVELHIEELRVTGLGVVDIERLRSALTAEFAALVQEHGAPRTGGGPFLDAGSVQLAPAGGDERVGRALARSIYGSVR
jgi:hypothetical protein